MKNILDEGTINFWIMQNENPHFKDPNSKITFMIGNDIGGIKVTIVKEQTQLLIILDNEKYGKGELRQNIIEYLNDDLMVTITWKNNSLALHLGAKKVCETFYK